MAQYVIKINAEQDYKVTTEKDGSLKLDGKEAAVDIRQLGKGKYHLIRNHKSYRLELVSRTSDKQMMIRVNNRNYEVEVEDRFDQLLHKLGMDELLSSQVKEIKAPMPGLVLSIEVEAGGEVKAGDPLIVLEAMKMENVLKSPVDGVVKTIAVKKGDAVEKNQLLIEFE